MIGNKKRTEELIKGHEGFSATPYPCTEGKLTIGYGINLEEGISKEEAQFMLENRIRLISRQLGTLRFWQQISGERQAVLIDMAYNLGMPRFLKFKKMLAALDNLDFKTAAEEMENSKWFTDVGERSKRLKQMMLTNKWVD